MPSRGGVSNKSLLGQDQECRTSTLRRGEGGRHLTKPPTKFRSRLNSSFNLPLGFLKNDGRLRPIGMTKVSAFTGQPGTQVSDPQTKTRCRRRRVNEKHTAHLWRLQRIYRPSKSPRSRGIRLGSCLIEEVACCGFPCGVTAAPASFEPPRMADACRHWLHDGAPILMRTGGCPIVTPVHVGAVVGPTAAIRRQGPKAERRRGCSPRRGRCWYSGCHLVDAHGAGEGCSAESRRRGEQRARDMTLNRN